jgi:hypothetical protein
MTPPQKRRPTLSRWLVVIACIVMAVATLTTWLQRQALSTVAWVDATDQLLADDEVRGALAVFLVDELYNAVSVEDEIAGVLPDDLDGLAPILASTIREPATDAVDGLLATDEAREIWRTVSREAHAAAIAVLNDEGREAFSTAGGVVSIDLGQLVEALAERIGLSGDRLEGIPEDAGVVVLFESGELEAAQDIVRTVERAATALALLVLALFGAAIWFASSRRRTLRNVGIGITVVGLVVAFARLVGIGALTSGEPGSSEPAWSVLDIGTALLRQAALTQISLGLLLVAVAVLVGPTDAAARVRRFLSPALRYGAASVAVGGTALAVGFIWFRADGPAASWIVVLVFFAACLASVAWLQQVSLRENPT